MNNQFRDVLTKQGGIQFEDEQGVIVSYGYDPAINGYIHVYIDGIDPILNSISSKLANTDIQNGIACLARGFTMPEISLTEINYQGMLDIKLPGKLMQGSEISFRFIDTLDLALTSFLTELFRTIRPLPVKGANNSLHEKLVKLAGNDYQYLGTMNALVFTTDPALDLCTNAMACIGLWPKHLPKDHLNVEINQNELYTFTQNFSLAYSVYGDDVIELGQEILEMYRNRYEKIW